MKHTGMSRRGVIMAAGAATAAAMIGSARTSRAAEAVDLAAVTNVVKNGRINQGVCMGVFKGLKLDFEQAAALVSKLGLKSIDLQSPKNFETLKKHNLVCSMTSGVAGGIAEGWNRKENHDKIVESLKPLVEATAAAGFPNVICFSGNRKGMADDEA
jgi:hydroxypyruvate isomerase